MSLFPATDAGQAQRYDAWYDGGWGAHAWQVESAALLEALGAVAGRTVLDLGCGTGRLAGRLLEAGARPVAVDLEPGMLADAAGRAPGRVLQADGHRLPLADMCVDAAVALTALEFTRDPAAVLAELARVTRPGGRLVVGTLNPRSPWGVLDRPRRRPPYRAARFLSRTELLRLGSRHGRAQVRSTLFGAQRLPRLAGVLERVGPHVLPRWGALHVLVVDLPAG